MDPRDLGPDQASAVGQVLARAMFADPLAMHMLPDPGERARLLPVHLGKLALYCALFGKVQAIGDPIRACAIWLGPGNTEMTPDRIEAAGLHQLGDLIGESAVERFFAVIDHMDTIHGQVMTGDHWYLQVIGVDPDAQKSGLGDALLAPVLAQAAADRLPCYLETFAQGTVRYYEQRGFDVVAQGRDPVADLAYWAMRRS